MIQENGEVGRSLTSAFWGLLLPGAEWLVPWYKYRSTPLDKKNSWVERHIRFQRNWFLLRFVVLISAGIWATQISYAPKANHIIAKDESDFSIPGDTGDLSEPSEEAKSVENRSRQTFQFSRRYENGSEDIEIRREFIGGVDPNSILVSIVGILVAVLLWTTSMTLTLVNVFRVSAAKYPFFPLTLKKKADRSQP